MKVFLLAAGLSSALAAHDFFVSILTIRHKPETQTLDLTWRMTAHDIEHALSDRVELKLGSATEYPKADSLLNRYFLEHLTLFQEDKQMVWKWVGKELDGETLYCYLQVEGVYTPNDLMVSNTLLQDVFIEQQNLVHVEGEKMPTRSHTFIKGSSPHTFTW
ncbi:MAG: hypothetical protein IPG10_17340 [Flavobacteriales bacterium]|nr:hypothetical protein [Flavobacteriales bacterium]MBK6755294.1 hypothetical protein [Flavobacteriales bacterium]MBK9075099.1 hypothetical protein [Flavobacteriales bacterium]MBK9540340.1 hypothetical protein [Flavobacteriales bacterium]